MNVSGKPRRSSIVAGGVVRFPTRRPATSVEQQRRDVMAVCVRIHEQEDLVIAQLAQVHLVAHTAAEGRNDVLQLLVGRQFGDARLLRVEYLAAQRQDRLGLAIAPLFGRATGRVALDNEQLALGRVGRCAVGQLAWQVEAM